MLEVRLLDNSVQMFQKLQWLPSDRIIREKTLYMMFKTLNKECDLSTVLSGPQSYEHDK